ncbi:MAG: hydrogenase [Deltaproteobacteria bacterium]|jgi:hydrogenase-4 component B|nr:hydrogenase [Deltaproteobacteria bacterium]
MNLFFLSLAIILCGGFLPLIFWRKFALMKTLGVVAIGGGSLLGLMDAGTRLFRTEPSVAVFNYLKTFSLAFQVDALSAFFLVAIYTICLLAALYSYHYMDDSQKSLRTAGSYFFFSLLTVFMALVVTASNLITFMLAWEIMSLSSFFLVIYTYEAGENRKAGYLYFVFSQVGAMFILAAFALIYAHTGNFEFADAATLPHTAKIIVFVLAFIGLGSKAGVFPLHVWLPHAHPAASSHISGVMSGVMIKTGIYGIVRMYVLLDWHTPFFGHFVLIAGMVSGVLGVVYALGQHDLKRLLAYHSVENIGIILIGIGVGMIGVAADNPVMAVLGFAGGLLHVLNHAIFKSLLFMGAGMVLHKTGTRTIDLLGGLIKKMKITGTTFLIGSLAISGLPPLNGFVSEFLVYMGSFRGMSLDKIPFAMCLLAIVSLAIIGGLALACFTKVVGVVFQGEPRNQVAENTDEKGLTMLVPMLILAAACFVIGAFPTFFMTMALQAVGSLGLDYGRIPLEPLFELTGNITRGARLFFAVFLVVLALRTLLYRGKTVTRSGTWGCGFTKPTAKMQYTGSSYAASILEFFRPVAPLSENEPGIRKRFPEKSHYHSHVSDIAELHMDNVVVRPVLALFEKLRWLQHGDIHLYIGYILLAIVVLLFFV